MTISQISLNTANWVVAAPATGVTVNYPSGTTAGDKIIAFWSYYLSGGGTLSTADGGSVVSGSNQNFDGSNYAAISELTFVGTEGSSDNYNFGGSAYATVGACTFRGSVETPGIQSLTASSVATTATTIDAPSVSAQSGDVLICVYFFEDPPGTVTAPSGMTFIMSGSNSTMSLRAYKLDITGSGATGAKTCSWTNTRDAIAMSFVLREGAGGGGGSVVPLFMSHYEG